MNTTTPTPSLNSDSPAIFAARSLGAFRSLSRPITAIGSVGEINAPNTRQTMNGTDIPSRPNTRYITAATATVEIMIPIEASVPIDHLLLSNCSSSTCNAPANSRKHNIPCINASLKSISSKNPVTAGRTWIAGTSRSSASTTSELASAIARIPMLDGNRR